MGAVSFDKSGLGFTITMNIKWSASHKILLRDMLLIALLSGLLFMIFLGGYHLIVPDEGRYSEVAREMAVSGNWLTPTLNGLPFLDKPILQYWINAFFIHLFGFNQFSARLGSVFIGIVGCEFIYLAGRELFDRKTGWLAALLLMTTFLYFFAARYINMDLAVAVWLSGSLYYFLMGMEKPQKTWTRSWRLYLAYIFAACAFLTKGSIGLVFPMLIIGAWVLVLWDWRLLREMYIPSGLMLFALLVTPWYWLSNQATPGFLDYFFWNQNIERFTGLGYFNNDHKPIFYYLPVVLIGLFPWTIFLFQALKEAGKHVWQNRQLHRKELFLLLYALLIFIFFSIPSSKIIGYILPIFSPLILLIARYLARHWSLLSQYKSMRHATFAYILFCVLGAIGGVAVTLYPSLTTPESAPYFYFLAGVSLVSAIAAFSWWVNHRRFYEFLGLLLLTLALIESIVAAGFDTFSLRTTKPVDEWLMRHAHPTDRIVSFHRFYEDMPAYLQHRVIVVLPNWQDPTLVTQHDDWESELAKGLPYAKKNQQILLNDADFVVLWNSSEKVWVYTNPNNYVNLQNLLHTTPKIVYRVRDNVIVTNHD